MSCNRLWVPPFGSAPGTIRYTGIQLVLAAALLGAASASGDILDFESLPYPTTAISSNGGMVYDPFSSYMGFRFSSENFYPPESNSPFANVWFDYALTATPYYSHGYPDGINGARALGVPMYDQMDLCTFSIDREGGGEWMFGGAQFSRVQYPANDAVFRIVGWRDGSEVYNITTQLAFGVQQFFGASVDNIAVDQVVMTYRYTTGPLTASRWFTMDDMHYELVPAPGALVLLSVCGLLRQRRRG